MTNVTDLFELLMSEEEESAVSSLGDIVYMLKESLNKFGAPDIEYIAKGASVTVKEAVEALKGAIFQSPEYFEDKNRYSFCEGWVFAPGYLSGNVVKKLETARLMNARFRGRFEDNIDALEKVIPPDMDIDDIHIGIGAPWIPAEEYEEFIRDLLDLRGKNVQVVFNEDLARFKVVSTPEADSSVINNYTYGVRGERPGFFGMQDKQYLTALDIIEHTLNAKTVKVYDYIPKMTSRYSSFEYDAVLNKSKTVEAQDKQSAIIGAFEEWVHESTEREERFKEYYNSAFPSYVFPQYDGSFLTLPGLNPAVMLYKHQKNSIARILFSDSNILLAQPVGTGKTFEMVISIHEMKRMHISEKNLIVVPNNVLQATVDAHRLLYRDDSILVIYPKDFTRKHRDEILRKVRDGDFTAIYMAASSFDMIEMSKKYYSGKLESQINDLKASVFASSNKYEKQMLDSHIKVLSKRLSKLVSDKVDNPWLPYDELGITTLVVDEFHYYKNIPFASRADNLVGMHKAGSKKCAEMLEKVRFTDRVVAATGTPLTNSMADLFTLQTYLQPGVLEYHKISCLDAWLNTFGRRETSIECDVDANSKNLRTVTRFASFHNLGELMSLFSQVCIFEGSDAKEIHLPDYDGPVDVCIPRSASQAEYFRLLSERTDAIRRGEVDRSDDNLLKVSADGRAAALDVRLTERKDLYTDGEQNKIGKCAEKIVELYRAYPGTAQIVFSDIGTPKANCFNVYDALADTLSEMGIPRVETAFVHDAVTESQRAKLFEAVNKGLIRVVVGSTQKLGVGVNLQEKLIALHHLSVPFRPADMVQREGRILRAGNTCEKVFVFRYICEGTFDSFSYQLLENKQRFISSFLSGTAEEREIEDIGEAAVLSYADAKALAIGNPLVRTRFEVQNKLERTKIACRARQRQLQALKGVVDAAPARIKRLAAATDTARRDCEYYLKQKMPISLDDRTAFGEELLLALKENILYEKERVFDEYQGFEIVLPEEMLEEYPYVNVRRAGGGSYRCEIENDKTPMGCSRTIDYLLDHLGERADKLSAQMADIEKQVAEAESDLDRENPYLSEVEELTARLAKIDSELSNDDKKAS